MDQTITNTWHVHAEGGGKERHSPQRLWKQYPDQTVEGRRQNTEHRCGRQRAKCFSQGCGVAIRSARVLELSEYNILAPESWSLPVGEGSYKCRMGRRLTWSSYCWTGIRDLRADSRFAMYRQVGRHRDTHDVIPALSPGGA